MRIIAEEFSPLVENFLCKDESKSNDKVRSISVGTNGSHSNDKHISPTVSLSSCFKFVRLFLENASIVNPFLYISYGQSFIEIHIFDCHCSHCYKDLRLLNSPHFFRFRSVDCFWIGLTRANQHFIFECNSNDAIMLVQK